ncbi:isopentenyl phosphate kinase [Geoglobus acetivorans]|uniref:Isopentenyl phosphate kinase n=1 Tax=Geoglobus acetivorans TaxID=565033 RepID=A0ABZ3H7H4_GEOAI|nr:isopentenyl phosphate kinase family protein [Geoglobus acetivorans]
MKILKIGGSLITDKSEGAFEIAKTDIMDMVSRQIRGEVILVHGAGSFGHPHVKKFGLSPEGVSRTHSACLRLNSIFCNSLIEHGLNPIPLHPMEFFNNPDFEFIKELVSMGFIPVLHGDVVLEGGKFRVMSGDEIVRVLAEELGPEAVGFASDLPVIVDGKPVEEINSNNFTEILKRIGDAGNKEDVTGGMKGKLEEAIRIARICDVFIFNGLENGAVEKFLEGRHVGTRLAKII